MVAIVGLPQCGQIISRMSTVFPLTFYPLYGEKYRASQTSNFLIPDKSLSVIEAGIALGIIN